MRVPVWAVGGASLWCSVRRQGGLGEASRGTGRHRRSPRNINLDLPVIVSYTITVEVADVVCAARFTVESKGVEVELRLLGPVEIHAGRAPLSLGVPQRQAGLAALAGDVGRVGARQTRVHRVCGDDPPGR